MDDDEKRKVFLTNTMSLFLIVVMILVFLNDIFNSGYHAAASRRLGVIFVMLLIPVLNHWRKFKLSKSIFMFFPGFILLVIPIIIGDFYNGQFVWFQYASAIFCSIPIILYDYRKEKAYVLFFFSYYLLMTLFIDKALLYYHEPPEALKELVTNFTDFKLPPLFVAVFSTATFLWYNRINSQYETRLKNANEELKETHEELIARNEEIESINRSLEVLVQERTKILDTKNRQIIEYANINAHKVRGPLARIMGLLNISSYSGDPAELKGIFDKLGPPSQELNKIIGEINRTLEQKDEDSEKENYR